MRTDIDPYGPPPEAVFPLSSILPRGAWLEPGIYFGLDEKTYHDSFGLSYSGIKYLRISPYDWWVRSPLNPGIEKVKAEEASTLAQDMGRAFDARIISGQEYFYDHYAPTISPADYPDALRTADDMKQWLEDRGLSKTFGSKAIGKLRIRQADPSVQFWEDIEAEYLAENKGKELISQDLIERIETSAAMIEKHPELSKALSGGAPQVTVVWYCEKTGVLCRARFDYLKPKLITDLKTLLPKEGKSYESTMGAEIGHRKYFIQAVYYLEAASHIPGFIREGKVFGEANPAFLDQLLKHPEKEWLWIFQLKGVAPVAKGRLLHKSSTLLQIGRAEVDNSKHTFRACLDRYGALPWVDPKPIKPMDDADIPAWSIV